MSLLCIILLLVFTSKPSFNGFWSCFPGLKAYMHSFPALSIGDICRLARQLEFWVGLGRELGEFRFVCRQAIHSQVHQLNISSRIPGTLSLPCASSSAFILHNNSIALNCPCTSLQWTSQYGRESLYSFGKSHDRTIQMSPEQARADPALLI